MIGVIGLLVVGPERLPEFARTIGRWVGQAQRMVRSVRADIERELETENLRSMINQQEEKIQELKGLVKEVREDTETSIGAADLSKDLNRIQEELNSDATAGTDAGTARAVADSGTPETAAAAETAEASDKKP